MMMMVQSTNQNVDTVTTIVQTTSKGIDELRFIFDKVISMQSSKEPITEVDQRSSQPTLNPGDERIKAGEGIGTSKGPTSMQITPSEETFHVNTEEYNWGLDFIREMGKRHAQQGVANHVRMLRVDFPRYKGGDPIEWQMNYEYYFEMYQVPEIYKTRLAAMYFSEDLSEWYRTVLTTNQPPPWDILVEEISVKYKLALMKHPVDELKMLHQLGTVEEYIKKFSRVKAKLLYYDANLKEIFFIQGFLSGLKEEIRHLMNVLNPKKLNEAF
jgi:Retrotransposon gag protein